MNDCNGVFFLGRKPACKRKPRISKTEALYDKRFLAKYALTSVCETKCASKKQYWLSPNRKRNRGFVVDVGCKRRITSIQLQNTHNGACNDRQGDA